MIIKRCDRCGKTYKPEDKFKSGDNQIIAMCKYRGLETRSNYIDLCPECAEGFNSWMREYGDTEAQGFKK